MQVVAASHAHASVGNGTLGTNLDDWAIRVQHTRGGCRHKLLSINGNITRGVDAQADLATVYLNYRDGDIFTDVDLLSYLPAQH
jgi:hypothetical protein